MDPQSIPEGLDVTSPTPKPCLVTERVNCWSVNVAVTEAAAIIVTKQLPVPQQAPPQPAKSGDPLTHQQDFAERILGD